MNLFAGKPPAERNKAIAAIALGAVACLLVLRLFLGSPAPASPSNAPRETPGATNAALPARNAKLQELRQDPLAAAPRPVVFEWTAPTAPQIGRNIFAYYVPPPTPTPAPPVVPTPTPAPPPTLVLAALNPASVIAGTGDFTLEVSGDKFTPAVRVLLDEREVPTRFLGPQRLTASIPGALITAEGDRRVIIRSPDGALFSNLLTLRVSPAPKPPYTFVGLIGGPSYNDTAVLKEDNSGKLLNVRRGEIVGEQWRVTSISERAVELAHVSVRLKRTLPFVANPAGGATTSAPRPAAPPPQPNSDDDQ